MSELIATDAQMLEQDSLVTVYELDLREWGEPILRFCSGPVDGMAVVFNGKTYSPVPIEAEGFKYDGQGTMPSPTLTLSAMDPSLASLVRQGGDLLGAPITRLRTYRKYLDDGDSPDPSAQFPPEDYVLERKSKQTPQLIEFELSVAFDQEGKKIPGRQVLRDSCTHTYRSFNPKTGEFIYRGVTCPYVGSQYFTRNDEPTSLAEEDSCGKRLSSCERRFKGTLPFYGFPGVDRI